MSPLPKSPLHSVRKEESLPRHKRIVLSKKEIGQRVRTLRKEQGMTQVELATAVGTHQTSLSQIERGVRGVGIQHVLKLAKALKVSPDRLLAPTKPGAMSAPRNEKLLRRVRRVEKLPPGHQDAVVKMLDAFLDTRVNGRR